VIRGHTARGLRRLTTSLGKARALHMARKGCATPTNGAPWRRADAGAVRRFWPGHTAALGCPLFRALGAKGRRGRRRTHLGGSDGEHQSSELGDDELGEGGKEARAREAARR
jgi:hypothetical protein